MTYFKLIKCIYIYLKQNNSDHKAFAYLLAFNFAKTEFSRSSRLLAPLLPKLFYESFTKILAFSFSIGSFLAYFILS